VFLGLFANIESLVITGAYPIHVHTALLHPAWRTNLGTLFWNLKEIYIKTSWYWTHTTIIPFLQLPNLQLLVLDYFNQRTGLFGERLEQFDPPTGSGDIDEGEDSEKPLSIERLSFLLAEWQPEEMGHLLARSPRLRSLVWEERSTAQLPGDGSHSEDEYSDEEGQVEVGIIENNAAHSEAAVPRSTALENFPSGASLDIVAGTPSDMAAVDGDLDTDCSIGEPPYFPWVPGCEPGDLFKPSLFLEQLVRTHGETLKHLSLRGCGFPPYPRGFKILHFLEFKALTHLEFDTSLLRNRKGDHFAFPPLAKVLPRSLEEFSLVIDRFWDEESIVQLLGSMPTANAEFLHLRRVFVQFVYSDLPMHPLTLSYLPFLREKFNRLDIMFHWRNGAHRRTVFNFNARNRNPLDYFLPHPYSQMSGSRSPFSPFSEDRMSGTHD
jgi:hypothetical protein